MKILDIKKYLSESENNGPLVVFRFLFGMIMLFSILRFVANGWIESLYLQPEFFFPYYGFGWISYPGDIGIYLLFAVCAVSALFVGLGFLFRISIITFFLSFTWIEFIDKSLYLNHYYFVSVMAGLLIFLPAADRFSIDSLLKGKVSSDCPKWTILAPKLVIGCLYFFAGLAKIDYQWLFEALPLKLWLPANSHLPIVGELLTMELTAYVFSWVGMIFDLTIFFFLMNRKARPIAYLFVVIFHLSTALLFQIGMFPYIMPLVTLIFFSHHFHERIIGLISWKHRVSVNVRKYKHYHLSKTGFFALTVFFVFMLIFPLRHLIYPGNLYWHEQGYRFGWRVMLIEKAGYSTFYVNKGNGDKFEVNPNEYLTANQEKQMSTQPDMVLQFAEFLENEYRSSDEESIKITCECYATLNGSKMRPLIADTTDLTKIEDTWQHKDWVIDYD